MNEKGTSVTNVIPTSQPLALKQLWAKAADIGPRVFRLEKDMRESNRLKGMRQAGRFGFGTEFPFKNVGTDAGDLPGTGLHIKGSAVARLILEGNIVTSIWCDTGGAANDKILSFQVDGGIAKYLSANDDLTTRVNNILVMDMETGDVSFGYNAILPKTSGNGIKVDTAIPTFGWRDLLGPIRTRGVGATDPADATYIGNIKAYQFAVNDECWVDFCIPHDYAPGTDIYLHFHWSQILTTVTGGNVTWAADVTYAKGHNQAAFPATVNPSIVSAASTVQYQHMIHEVQISAATPGVTQIDSDNLEPDGVIMIRGYLSANNITVSGGAVPDPFLHYVDIHYQSTNIATKAKVPDFYT